MMTLHEIEERAHAIQKQMDKIFKEMAYGFEGRADRAVELAEQLTALVDESKVLNNNLDYYRQMAEQLVSTPCSGPH